MCPPRPPACRPNPPESGSTSIKTPKAQFDTVQVPILPEGRIHAHSICILYSINCVIRYSVSSCPRGLAENCPLRAKYRLGMSVGTWKLVEVHRNDLLIDGSPRLIGESTERHAQLPSMKPIRQFFFLSTPFLSLFFFSFHIP